MNSEHRGPETGKNRNPFFLYWTVPVCSWQCRIWCHFRGARVTICWCVLHMWNMALAKFQSLPSSTFGFLYVPKVNVRDMFICPIIQSAPGRACMLNTALKMWELLFTFVRSAVPISSAVNAQSCVPSAQGALK